jgi:hypothetical protein
MLSTTALVLALAGCDRSIDDHLVRTHSPQADIFIEINTCDLYQAESALKNFMDANQVQHMALDDRFDAVNPEDVLTILGQGDGFSVDASNFTDRKILSIAIYADTDDLQPAITFADVMRRRLPNILPCSTLLPHL